MHFELAPEEQDELGPLHEELEHVGTNWRLPLEKLEAMVEGDPVLEELLEDVLDQSLRYTKTVLDERKAALEGNFGEDYIERDNTRSISHEATQASIRAFVRNLVKADKQHDEAFALMPNVESRAACGKFALFLTLSRF